MSNFSQTFVTIGRNRSGMDSGEIDMAVAVTEVEALSLPDLIDVLKCLDMAKESVSGWYAKHGLETAKEAPDDQT